ncbi:MFS transporter [Wukongibacter sp. M2B1]|uniref:MFS transporter n=1 Tax=Wukongibacter sp. M2B1 TaxID=3088895 RepID=UPI003D790F4F
MESQINVKRQEKLWNMNFFLLWQGAFVSTLGDVVYEIALGFWVLAVTGSTALMGTLMAATAIPRVLISPFAGVVVDRVNRKHLLVLMDLIRGVFIIGVGVAAYQGVITVWMVFVSGVILGICSAFFIPAVNSVLPDIVPKSKLMGANSVLGIIETGSNIIGNAVGGIAFQMLGTPFIFLINGISYVLSAFTEAFLRIPKIEQRGEQKHFMKDMKEGCLFVWKAKGLRYFLLILSIANFVICIVMILLLPLYQQNESLGPAKYGVSMAFLTGGMFLGMIFTSVARILPSKRRTVYLICTVVSNLCFILFALTDKFPMMLTFIFIGGAFMSVSSVLITSTIQLIIPQDMRGKVFALIGMITQSLTPLGMGVGGILAEFIPIRTVIFVCFLFELLIFIPVAFDPSFKRFINFDEEKETLESIFGYK